MEISMATLKICISVCNKNRYYLKSVSSVFHSRTQTIATGLESKGPCDIPYKKSIRPHFVWKIVNRLNPQKIQPHRIYDL
jgi:hypothetical protein